MYVYMSQNNSKLLVNHAMEAQKPLSLSFYF